MLARLALSSQPSPQAYHVQVTSSQQSVSAHVSFVHWTLASFAMTDPPSPQVHLLNVSWSQHFAAVTISACICSILDACQTCNGSGGWRGGADRGSCRGLLGPVESCGLHGGLIYAAMLCLPARVDLIGILLEGQEGVLDFFKHLGILDDSIDQ